MNVTNQNQSLVESEMRSYFIRLTICYKKKLQEVFFQEDNLEQGQGYASEVTDNIWYIF